jgi:aspartate beta-hydroxylase
MADNNYDNSLAKRLNAQAMSLLGQGRHTEAEQLLTQAVDADANQLPVWINLAGVRRVLNDLNGAQSAVSAALKLNPRSFFALFLRGTILRQAGENKQAASAFKIAIQCAPLPHECDTSTMGAIEQAKAFCTTMNADKEAFLRDRLSAFLSSGSHAERTRAEILLGNQVERRKPFRQEPLLFDFPHLPAIEFWEREEFPWLESVEAATKDIQSELRGIMAGKQSNLVPYIHYGEGLPLDQWQDLNHSTDWSAYHLIEGGLVSGEARKKCPKTLSAMKDVPQPTLQGRSPVLMFSVLRPHTHIPPHTGASNARLLCHLPLIVPPNCLYRVGGSYREWKVGEAFIFDDTIEHEAHNNSNEVRVVLIFDVWNPRLTDGDKALIVQMSEALDLWEGKSGQRRDWT